MNAYADPDRAHDDVSPPVPSEQETDGWIFTGGCTCNAIYCGPGSGHESYCGWVEA
jgi:hypothetical protein